MKYYRWDDKKNEDLKIKRGVSFEDVIFSLEQNRLIEDVKNPNEEKYEGQRIFVTEINNYAYLVPYVEKEREVFLKTIIPSRKATRRYLRKERDHEKDG